MNKKFINGFLLASLVAGSSSFLSSCKDYDDDIDQLRTEVAANKTAIDDINSKIAAGAILESVTKNANGITVTVSKNGQSQTYDITNGTNADVWTIENTANGYFWAKNGTVTQYPAQGPQGPQGVQGNYWKPNDEGTKLIEHVWNAETGKYEPTSNTVDIAITVPGSETPNITAVVDGSYVYLTGVQTGTVDGKPVYGNVAISRSGLITGLGFIPDLYLDGVEGTRFGYVSENYLTAVTIGATGTATFNNASVNFEIPVASKWAFNEGTTAYQLSENAVANFDLNPDNANIDGVKFSFLPIANIEQVSSRAAAPSVVFKSAVAENGNLAVTYNVQNPASMAYTTDGKNTLPITALTANLKANAEGVSDVVTSDYYSLVMSQVQFTAISFIPTTTTEDKHLALTGKAAIDQSEGKLVKVAYTQAPEKYDLSKNIRICYKQADFGKDLDNATEKQMSLKEAADKWGLTVTYSMMNYYAGESKTNDSQYASIDANGVLDLKYRDANNQWVSCGDNDASRSAIGRHPVVMVNVCNGNNVVLAGYVLFEITDVTVTPEISNTGIVLAQGEPMPYLCTSTNKVVSTWETTTSQVLSVLGMSEAQFKEQYTLAANETYVKAANWTAEKQAFTQVANNKYGVLNYNPDSQAGPTNGFLTWNYTLAAATQIAKDYGKAGEPATVELFVKFVRTNNPDDCLFLGVSITILPAPSVTYGTLNPYLLVPGTTNQVGMSTLQVSNALGKDVTYFEALLESYYTDNKITPAYIGQTGAKYPAVAGIICPFAYTFDKTQMTGLNVSPDGLTLKKGTATVATVDGTTGLVKFAHTAAALELLNSANGVYANVHFDAKYCNENPKNVATALAFTKQENNVVRINFRKPVTVTGVNNYVVSPDGKDPKKEELGNFFTMVDYFGNSLFLKGANGYVANETKAGKDMFDWYQISEIKIDLTGLSENGVTFTVEGATKAGEVYTVAPATAGGVLDVDVLNDVKIVCDYKTTILEQAITVKVPVTVTYYWGTQMVEATVTVKPFKK